jgi:lipoate---protein ligase
LGGPAKGGGCPKDEGIETLEPSGISMVVVGPAGGFIVTVIIMRGIIVVMNKNVKWKVIDTGISSPEKNMQIDVELLDNLEIPTLHLYEWKGDCATYGHFTKPENFLNMDAVKKRGLNLAKRPTGGGIIFHLWDFAFSILVPADHPAFSRNVLDNYAYVNNIVIRALKKEGCDLLSQEQQPQDEQCRYFCMAKPTRYDVMLGEKKVGGAAQRCTKKGFLHQGTISLVSPPEEYLKDVLLSENNVLEAMKMNSYYLLGDNWNDNELSLSRKKIKKELKSCICH